MAYRFRDTTRRLRILFEFMGGEISGTSTRCCGKKIELSTANFSERLDNWVWGCGRMRVTLGYLVVKQRLKRKGGVGDVGVWDNFRGDSRGVRHMDVWFVCRRNDGGRF